MTPEREEKIKSVIKRRQPDLTVIIENVHDPHNIFAIMRTCDSVGIQEVFVIDTHRIFHEKTHYGKRSSASSMKWVDLRIYDTCEECMVEVRKKYINIYSTYLSKESVSLYELSLTGSTALVFGNEKDGLSKEVLKYCDQNFVIPSVGMIRSLNVSVACAVTLYEAYRQRDQMQMYSKPRLDASASEELFQNLSQR
ncbi:MAG: RNA methyltransferase [Chitinophagales bacterium]|nr:RNA methyltransferase [Chitinophagales bacterium]